MVKFPYIYIRNGSILAIFFSGKFREPLRPQNAMGSSTWRTLNPIGNDCCPFFQSHWPFSCSKPFRCSNHQPRFVSFKICLISFKHVSQTQLADVGVMFMHFHSFPGTKKKWLLDPRSGQDFSSPRFYQSICLFGEKSSLGMKQIRSTPIIHTLY